MKILNFEENEIEKLSITQEMKLQILIKYFNLKASYVTLATEKLIQYNPDKTYFKGSADLVCYIGRTLQPTTTYID